MTDRRRAGRSPLTRQFLIYYALAYVVLISLMGIFIERSARAALLDETARDLEVVANLASSSLPADPDAYEQWAEAVFTASDFRVTLIRTDGLVLADSHLDPAVTENHSDRPEIVQAMAGNVSSTRRVSASTGFEQVYLALPPQGDLIVRTSVPVRVVAAELGEVRSSIILVSVLVGLAGIAVVAFVANRMAKPIKDLTMQSNSVSQGHLDVSPPRSSVRELDQLGLAISTVAENLGTQIEEAERATATLEVVLGAIPQGTILVDAHDRVLYANPATHDLLGVVPEELGAMTPLQLQTAVRDARATGEVERRVVDHGTPGRRLRGIATPLADSGWVLLVIDDATERERTEAVRRDFVANASHELKTPVSTIIASSDALQIAVDRGDPSAVSFAHQIQTSARQLDSLVGDLLDLSRLEREAPTLTPVRLNLLVTDEVARIRQDAEAKQLTLEVSCDDALVQGSHRDLSIAIRNLLDNAVRYTDQGAIDVRLLAEDGQAVLTVNDSGVGIPLRDLNRVFERFYRVDAGRSRATGGTGLGLSIVRHVVRSHGGEVEVDSELNVGSTFTMRLPLTSEGATPASN